MITPTLVHSLVTTLALPLPQVARVILMTSQKYALFVIYQKKGQCLKTLPLNYVLQHCFTALNDSAVDDFISELQYDLAILGGKGGRCCMQSNLLTVNSQRTGNLSRRSVLGLNFS